MKTNQNSIFVHNLKKKYKDKEVLKGVNLTVKKGTVFCLLGSNGSGKTTTVKILSTLLEMEGGKVEINGFDVNHQGDKVRQCISLTGQFSAVDAIMTGRENLEMMARLCHLKNYKKRAIELLNDFDLTDDADKRTSTYSGGMRRRLDIAMCLVGSPSVIFLDEPTTGLDPQSRKAMWCIIEKLKRTGTTIFLTTQYLEEAEQLADYVAILDDGRIIAEGSVEDIKKLSSKEYIVFSFSDRESIERSKEIFDGAITVIDEEALTITIAVDGGMKQIADIFATMRELGIESTSFNQKKASLEDVFLHLVEKKEEVRV